MVDKQAIQRNSEHWNAAAAAAATGGVSNGGVIGAAIILARASHPRRDKRNRDGRNHACTKHKQMNILLIYLMCMYTSIFGSDDGIEKQSFKYTILMIIIEEEQE